MSTNTILKERLLQELENLSEDKLREILDFVKFLRHQEQEAWTASPDRPTDPADDPILRFSGGVSHGSLAQDIDQTLYGE